LYTAYGKIAQAAPALIVDAVIGKQLVLGWRINGILNPVTFLLPLQNWTVAAQFFDDIFD
jgi:hypothetical protein